MKTLPPLTGKRVLLRADLNLPYHKGAFTDLTRLERLIPTLKWLLEKGARVLVLSHFGRPKGQDLSLSLAPLAPLMEQLTGQTVRFIPDCVGPQVKAALEGSESLFLLENVRFYAEEEAGNSDFAKSLAQHADLYMNDAFSVAHRAHASVVGITKYLPAYPGLQMHAELAALEGALNHPERPVAAIVGGSKVSTKLELLMNLVTKVDTLMIGGGMANTFLKAKGLDVGSSLAELDCVDIVAAIEKQAQAAHCQILLPCDGSGGENINTSLASPLIPGQMLSNEKIFDLGPQSIVHFTQALSQAKTLIWNGPVGVFEVPPYDQGTTALAQAVAQLTRNGKLISVAGGGDTVSALTHAGVVEDLTYVSTAGGAFLEWMEGKTLPGVAALEAQ